MDELAAVMFLSEITSVNAGVGQSKTKKAATKINRIVIGVQQWKVANPTEAVARTMEILLSSRMDKFEEILKTRQNIFTTEEENITGIFFKKKELSIPGAGCRVFIGTKTGYQDKVEQVTKICKVLDIDRNTVQWHYDETK